MTFLQRPNDLSVCPCVLDAAAANYVSSSFSRSPSIGFKSRRSQSADIRLLLLLSLSPTIKIPHQQKLNIPHSILMRMMRIEDCGQEM